MYWIHLLEGRQFCAQGGETLLDAAARSNIKLNYSCKTGRCSTCKCKVLQGSTNALHPETGLTSQEKADGWILSCVRSAETDVVLDVEALEGTLPPVKTLPCRISHLECLASDVLQVFLRLPPTVDFSFLPGQYIDVIGPNGIRRSYSLANSNFSNKLLELHIRAVEGGGMSQYWFNQARIGDLLRLTGPLGTFFLRETANVDLIFLATGTGIAPIKSILESMIAMPVDKYPKSVTILWGGRTLQDLYLDLNTIYGNHTFVPVLSRPNNGWAGAKGYVQDVLLRLNPDLEKAAVYACGSNVMIHSARDRLIHVGLSPKRFYSDAFVCSGVN